MRWTNWSGPLPASRLCWNPTSRNFFRVHAFIRRMIVISGTNAAPRSPRSLEVYGLEHGGAEQNQVDNIVSQTKYTEFAVLVSAAGGVAYVSWPVGLRGGVCALAG